MNRKEMAQGLVDLLAKALQVLDRASTQQIQVLWACPQYEAVFYEVQQSFVQATEEAPQVLLDTIGRLLQQAAEQPDAIRFIYALTVCQCIDQRITFSPTEELWRNGRFSLHSLVPIQSDLETLLLPELNRNKEETGICIFPKFPVSMAALPFGPTRSLNSRDALYGINGWLSHVGYYPWVPSTPTVKHIILSDRSDPPSGTILPEFTKIAFTPLSDRGDLLELCKPEIRVLYGIPCNTVGVAGIRDPEYIENRFRACWMAACREKVDIFFAPEMLATDNMVQIVHQGSVFLKPLLKEALRQGLTPPRLTVMPTHWKDRKNTAYLFDEMGKLCGGQSKGTPFVNVKKGWAEDIDIDCSPDVLLIHMQNQQRIALVICAEFLANAKYVGDFLCGQLGATLILVPAYSMGEQDFINGLSMLKPYGASVVWGNCCGAASAGQKRIIGGGSFAGIDPLQRMGSRCQCGFACTDRESCLFVVEIPREIRQWKPDSPPAPEIKHLC